MSKHTTYKSGIIAEIPLSDIAYIGHFTSANLASKKGELAANAHARLLYNGKKADYLVNAELFGSGMSVASGVVENGVALGLQERHGYGFVDHRIPTFSYKNNVNAIDYVEAYPLLVRDNKKFFTEVPAGLSGGNTGTKRTAMALKDDTFALAVLPGNTTLEELAQQFVKMGYDTACNLDGGGSTQGILKGSKFTSTRPVRGFIGVWLISSGNPVGGTITEAVAPALNVLLHNKTASKGVKYYANVPSSYKLYIRKSPSLKATILKQLPRGTAVTWYGYCYNDGSILWKYVKCADGTVGYAASSFLSKTKIT